MNPIQHRVSSLPLSTQYVPKSAPRMGHCVCQRSCCTFWLSTAGDHHLCNMAVHQYAWCGTIYPCTTLAKFSPVRTKHPNSRPLKSNFSNLSNAPSETATHLLFRALVWDAISSNLYPRLSQYRN